MSSIVIFSNIWSLLALDENLFPSLRSSPSFEFSSSDLDCFLPLIWRCCAISSPSYSSSSASLRSFSISKLISSSSGLFFGLAESTISMFSMSRLSSSSLNSSSFLKHCSKLVAYALGPLFSGVETFDLGFSIDDRVVEFSP